MNKTYQQMRIPRGALGYQMATDAIAQRGGNLDITRVCEARWLDMRLEMISAEQVAGLVEYEKELGVVIDKMMALTEEERRVQVPGMLADLAARYAPTDTDKRVRFNLFDALHRCDRVYGRENVAAFMAAYHPTRVAILDAVAAR